MTIVNKSELPHDMLEGLAPYDESYFRGLYEQLQDPAREALQIGPDFIPSSLLTPEERKTILGEVEGSEIEENSDYAEIARQTKVDIYDLNAGIGSSMGIEGHLEAVSAELGTPLNPKATKGSGLYYRGPDGQLYSGAQIKANRFLVESPHFGQMNICTVVNSDSEPVMRSVYSGKAAYGDKNKTYEELYAEAGNIGFGEWLHQGKIPTLDENKQLTRKRMAPGSHGHAGVMLMHHIRNSTPQSENDVSMMFNGDSPGSFVTPNQAGYTAKKAGMILYAVDKTEGDVKGGQIFARQLASGIWVPDIMERAQAIEAGQEDLFYNIGLYSDKLPPEMAAKHHVGEQGFNANNASFNNHDLHYFFKEVVRLRGQDYFNRFASPELMLNGKTDKQTGEKYYQMEGALASLMFQMNNKVLQDMQLQTLWADISGGKPFLQIVRMNNDLRPKCFSPVKFAIDQLRLSSTNLHELDLQRWYHIDKFPGHIPRFEGDLIQSGTPFSEVQRVHDAFGYAQMDELKELSVKGAFYARDAQWAGHVKIDTFHTDGSVDFNDPSVRQLLGQPDEGPLRLENVEIIVDDQGISSKKL